MYDSHIHSNHSFDSEQTISELCEEAIEKGMSGITVTDHVMVRVFDKLNTLDGFQTLFSDIEANRARYGAKLKLLCGFEISEILDDPSKYELIRSLGEFDVILGSVHYVGSDALAYAKIDFSESFSRQNLLDYLSQYFADVQEMILHTDIDVVCHLTCPLRYMVGRYQCDMTWKEFEPQIRQILQLIVEKDLALEINTAGYTDSEGYHTLPDSTILTMYYKMGGRKLTLGSDSHRNRAIGRGFQAIKEELRKIGFDHYCYFEKRKAINIPLVDDKQ